ncbi:oligopeptide ABC transporter substrate-binding protein [Paenibacillus dauci]|uniref:oligopeptide ABC transporter substrate-binding protein n=1 Tax=Paenibacillus dauci TaxID=1567106 RepID=UPI000619119F|nr:oligopeptide ABC transporter substrate-binding protein [Paenibacillus dauci]
MWGSKKKKSISILLMSMVLVLSACNSGGNSATPAADAPKTNESVKETGKFASKTSNSAASIQGGILNYGLASDTPFEGILNPIFYEGQPDYSVLQFFYPSLFALDKNFDIIDGGGANIKLSNENKTVTVTINDKLNWTDGNPVTAEDYAFAFEVIGNKDYEGVRYDELMMNIVGMEDYHAGKAKTISGIKILNDKEVQIDFIKATPSVKSGLWSYPLEKKVFADVPIADMSASAPVRKDPIGYGPFKIKSMVTGESVEFEANKDYFLGAPKLDGIHLKVVNPNVLIESLKKGDIDYVDSFNVSLYDEKTNPTNIEFLGRQELAYSYIGFKLGKYDKAKGESIMDPNSKMANKSLRQAMGYAMNNAQVGAQLYKGLRTPATSLIIPAFANYYDSSLAGYTYNPEKAKQLLDEAGYVDKDGDGLREDPKGQPLVINYAAMSGDPVSEPLAKFYMQNWKDIGLNVQLVNGRLQEFNSFYDNIKADSPDIDVFGAAWGTGSDIDPSGLYGRQAAFNYSRFTSEEADKLLEEGTSPKAFDIDYRKDVYKQWQQLMFEEAPVIPTLYRYELQAVNKRVKNLDISYDASYDTLAKVELSADKPVTQ